MYDDLVKRLRYLAKVYSICDNENTNEYRLAIEAADAIEELSKIREEQKAQIILMAAEGKPRLIPVTERLPEFEGAVLCMRKSNVYGVRPYQEILYVDEFGFKNFDDIYLADGVVTHWMPLPQPPEEET